MLDGLLSVMTVSTHRSVVCNVVMCTRWSMSSSTFVFRDKSVKLIELPVHDDTLRRFSILSYAI